MAGAVDKLSWKIMGGLSTTAAVTLTRKAIERAYKAGTGEEPPDDPVAPHVPLRQALLWGAVSGVIVELVRILVERTAAAAWVRARGELPPGVAEEGASEDVD